MKTKKSSHYVDNKKFLEEITKYKNEYDKYIKEEKEPPMISEFIGKCILDIGIRMSYRSNFIQYPYREEMVSDGIEESLRYLHKFDPNKTKNPFSYFTTVHNNAFLRRIRKEDKQKYLKFKSLLGTDDNNSIHFNKKGMEDFVVRYESKKEKENQKRRKKSIK